MTIWHELEQAEPDTLLDVARDTAAMICASGEMTETQAESYIRRAVWESMSIWRERRQYQQILDSGIVPCPKDENGEEDYSQYRHAVHEYIRAMQRKKNRFDLGIYEEDFPSENYPSEKTAKQIQQTGNKSPSETGEPT